MPQQGHLEAVSDLFNDDLEKKRNARIVSDPSYYANVDMSVFKE